MFTLLALKDFMVWTKIANMWTLSPRSFGCGPGLLLNQEGESWVVVEPWVWQELQKMVGDPQQIFHWCYSYNHMMLTFLQLSGEIV